MRRALGKPVIGEDFWPRPEIVDKIVAAISDGRESRRLFGLRRIGKTSILLEVETRLKARDELTVIRIDAQGCQSFGDFLGKLAAALPREGKAAAAAQRAMRIAPVKEAIDRVIGRFLKPGQPEGERQASVTDVLRHQALWSGDMENALKEAAPVVLIIDELPFMLRDMLKNGHTPADIERLLSLLRGWRFDCDLRLLLSGSIGLGHIERAHNIDCRNHVNDALPIDIPPLKPEDAIRMVDALADGEKTTGWTTELSRTVVETVAELYPIFLQYGFAVAADSDKRRPEEIAPIIVTETKRILDETFYAQFTTRLERYGSDQTVARIILKTTVATSVGGDGKTTFADIDAALAKAGMSDRRDDVMEAMREDDFVIFDTQAQTIWPTSRLVVIWVRARSWGR